MVFTNAEKNFVANLNTDYILYCIHAKTEYIRTYDKLVVPEYLDDLTTIQEYWGREFYEWVYDVEADYEEDLNENYYKNCNFDEWFDKWIDDWTNHKTFEKLFRLKTDEEYLLDFSNTLDGE